MTESLLSVVLPNYNHAALLPRAIDALLAQDRPAKTPARSAALSIEQALAVTSPSDLQFTPDGRRLALLLSNLVLTKSSHPLRRQDLTTSPTFQIV